MFPLPDLGTNQIPINLVISSNTTNYNAFTAAGSPSRPVFLTVTVNGSVTVSSTVSITPALSIAGFTAGSIFRLINNGTIQGAGGNGGRGGPGGGGSITPGPPLAGGHDGGDAVSCQGAIVVTNTVAIQGGGGGGCGFDGSGVASGNGGGGGQGNVGGTGGLPGLIDTGPAGSAGANGSPSAPGSGGGTWGNPGTAQSLSGGAGGFAIRCATGHATVTGGGTVNGGVS